MGKKFNLVGNYTPLNDYAFIKTKIKICEIGWISIAPTLTNSNPLRPSLFPNIPPTINFMLHNEISARELPDNIRSVTL